MSKLMRPARLSRQRGIALIEVLIAMLVTAFGLAAISLLLVATMQYGKMAQFQNSAQQLATGYAEQMRANPDGFTGGLYNKTSSYSSGASAVSVPTCSITSQCTAAELAAIDAAQWRNKLRANLPGGDAYVLRSGNAADIWVMWLEPGTQSGLDSLSIGGANCPSAALPAAGALTPRCFFFRVWF